MPSHALSDQKTADSNTALNTKLMSHHMRLLAISYLHRCGVNIVVSHFRPCIRVSEISKFIVVYYRGHLDVTVFLRSLTVSETPTVDQNYFYNQLEIYFEKKIRANISLFPCSVCASGRFKYKCEPITKNAAFYITAAYV